MFLHMSVILFTGGRGRAIPVCLAAGLQGGACSGGMLPVGGGGGGDPRKQTATVADGTHPTGGGG